MLFSWYLWQALHTEQPRHPIFRIDRREYTDPPRLLTKLLTDVLPFGVLALMVFSAWLLAIAFIAGLIFLLVFSGLIYGWIAAYGVSREVAKYRANGRYDLVALTPHGVFGATWAIGANFLQKTDSLGYLRWAMTRLYAVGICLLTLTLVFCAVFFNSQLTRYGDNSFQLYLLPGIANAFLWLGIHFLDFTRGGLLGTLIGWLAPTYTNNRREAHLLALALYLIFQIFTYIVFWLVGWEICGWMFAAAGITSPVVVNLVRLMLVVLIREGTLRGLWAMLLWRLNVSPAETQSEFAR
jgi:hypothetical protein